MDCHDIIMAVRLHEAWPGKGNSPSRLPRDPQSLGWSVKLQDSASKCQSILTTREDMSCRTRHSHSEERCGLHVSEG